MRAKLKAGFRTDIGKMRVVNEDALLVLPADGLFAVADGVGGSNSGDIASRRAVNGIEEFFRENPVSEADGMEGEVRHDWFKDYFLRCFRKINQDIRNAAAIEQDNSGMATTAVAAYFDGDIVYITNIGDSRAYILRAGEITQLTEDHSYVTDLVNAGTLTKSEAREHPQKNMITRALGAGAEADPDFYRHDIEQGDCVLLCSDGLHGELTDEEIRSEFEKESDLNSVCKLLVQAANEKGGHDNITIVCAAG
ncbi:MAG: Stp1/IreP family PP2C-type Ser/Thr phosphatase [Clostridiales Family XIII bacterium]|jgi:protein phosphatase|nr:Stp1/IreP family PP2C-type Ser/Thr phosphatase [Clostridiales Family XIII bacterium]